MAYPIIKSAWDNFSESYMKAREARAREERMKEQSMREFDQNQRLWNQEQRADDRYTSYEKPFNAYGLDNAGMTNEVTKAAQIGNMAVANFNSGLLSRVNTPENLTQEIARVNADRNLMSKIAQFRNETPDSVLKSASQLRYYTSGIDGTNATYDFGKVNSPEYQKLRENSELAQGLQSDAVLQELRDTTNAANAARANAARPASTYGDMFTSRMYSTTSGATPQPQAAKATATATNPTAPVAQTPMAAMTAKQPTLAEGYDATIKAIKDVEQQIGLIDLKTRLKNPEAYKQLETQLQILNAQRKNQANAMLYSPESLAQRKAFFGR